MKILMRTLTAFAIIGALLLTTSTTAQAARKISSGPAACRAVAWPFSRAQTREQIVRIFTHVKRQALRSYLFHEVSQPSESGLPFYLVEYLSGTEQNKDVHGFYELVRWGAELQDEKSIPKKLSLDEVCSLYSKAVSLRDRR